MKLIYFVTLLSSFVHAMEVRPMESSSVAHILRLSPDDDPKTVLMKYVTDKGLKAVSVVSAVGSLKETALRYANQNESVKLSGMREVVSMSGTLGATSGSHLHVSVSDGNGVTLGGHLVEGSKVYTTLEVVLLSYPDVEFARVTDPKTTYEELVIKGRK